MKASTWKTILQIAISFLTAIATTLECNKLQRNLK